MMNYFKHEKALVHPNAKIGEGTRVWAFANVLDGAVIGSHCNICDGCFIEKGGTLGDHVTLKNHVSIWDGITLENNVFVGAGVIFINDRFPRSNRADAWTLERTVVKEGATIGAGATVMCGLTVGEFAVVGAASVVTKHVAPFTIVVGNPARFQGYACRCGRKLNHDLKCSCGLSYRLQGQSLSPA
ncbi:MAG: N-acetyltransferase [Candidatus Omnitrophica bacterium]|nr:N-acetyltransferase [Candidatus Omnitrophota bacterium]